ncbi:RNA 2'-phosphotransferase [Aphanothece hegewaldii CCALA 016]|uniref:Probable RNA 2'-phosphotransferase n=1 Tax=Aphanothece hegewaldii CCALA 016 TaxID=2107694 RepID=A0A2T1M367_9CHRO|nr:RNA 2'-phosphotransferase [Aphanothece hegewaldii]PSF39279.1 RNA 2'-phosphotransferase [Aphanothece hegewaldii CCALA 016]
MEREDKKISKFLSLVLRHKPEVIALTLDENGWADVDELIISTNAQGWKLTLSQLERVVRTNDKQRFSFNDDETKIRANQGHSIAINLELEVRQPPEILLHGTATRFIESIKSQGLHSQSRRHVHLSLDEATARAVSQRHGKPVVLQVRAGEMWRSGIQFYLSENGVWLVEAVPIEFINFPFSYN